MADTFDRLMAVVPPRPPLEKPRRGWLVVEGIDPAHSFNENACLVGIDGRRKATLYASSPRTIFEVDEGDHQVSVRLGRDLSVPLPIQIVQDELIVLVCGKKSEWIEFESRLMKPWFIPFLTCYGLGGLVWLAYPLMHAPGLSLFSTAVSVTGACLIPSFVAMFVQYYWGLRRLRAEFGPKCYVEIRPLGVIKIKSPTLAWDGE